MLKYVIVVLALAISSMGLAQSSEAGMKHYRLTFVVKTGHGEAGKQSFMLDVPVAPEKMGAARASITSASEGDAQSLVQELLECSNIHESATGLALHIALQSDREAPAIPGVISTRHQHGEFQRNVDLKLGEPTVVTQEMTPMVLGSTDPSLAEKLKQPTPTITVTADSLQPKP